MLDELSQHVVVATGESSAARGPSLDELLQSNEAFRARVDERTAANQGLRRALALALETQRQQTLPCQLAVALRQVGDTPPELPLSCREREVLRLLTDGSRSPCIAAQLNISPATVEVHRRNIMRKLGLHSVAALTKYAVRAGLTSL